MPFCNNAPPAFACEFTKPLIDLILIAIEMLEPDVKIMCIFKMTM
jgi:hypothetical protein